MRKTKAVAHFIVTVIGIACLLRLNAQPAGARRQPVHLQVKASASIGKPVSGRLLIFLKQGSGDKEVDSDAFHPRAVWIAAREVQDLKPGSAVEIDADELAFPGPFSDIPPGDYEAQAVLDVDHSYNYSGRGAQDWISTVTPLAHWKPGADGMPRLTIDRHPAEDPRSAAAEAKMKAAAQSQAAVAENFLSPALSRFWGHPVQIRAWVILPPGYNQNRNARYPTVYWTHGFGANLKYALFQGLDFHDRMQAGKLPAMIWVMLDESVPQGTHEFADSVNNGPWGTALTSEFLPYLERKYGMDSPANGRFLNGHSSGGWATLQLQVNYPKILSQRQKWCARIYV